MILHVNILSEYIKFILCDCLLETTGKSYAIMRGGLNLSLEESEISNVNSYNIDRPWDEIRICEVSFCREKALGSFWALILESLSRVTETCRSGVEIIEGHGHNAVILKVKYFHLTPWNLKINLQTETMA